MINAASLERVVVLDTETTGLSKSDRIVELAAIEVEPRTGRIGPTVHRRVNPGKPIPRAATRIHGIRDADVRDEPSFGALACMVGGLILARGLKPSERAGFLADCQAFLKEALTEPDEPA